MQLNRSEQRGAECVLDELRPSLSPEVWNHIKWFISVGGWGATLPLGKRRSIAPTRYYDVGSPSWTL
jgi:hypothetical protein